MEVSHDKEPKKNDAIVCYAPLEKEKWRPVVPITPFLPPLEIDREQNHAEFSNPYIYKVPSTYHSIGCGASGLCVEEAYLAANHPLPTYLLKVASSRKSVRFCKVCSCQLIKRI